MSAQNRKFRLVLVLGALVMLFAVPVIVQAQANATVTNAYRLNCRSGPGVQHGVVTILDFGNALTLTARNHDATWVQGIVPGGFSCWVNSRYVATSINIYNLPVGGTTPPPQPPATATGYVNTPLLNLRTGPGANFNIVAKLSQNTGLTLQGRNADASWVQVATGSGNGWVSARYIVAYVPVSSLPVTNNTGVTPGYPPPVTYEGQSGVVANAYFLNVRTGPSVWYPPFTVVANGTPLRMLSRNASGTWVLIQLYNGRTGWVNSRYISTNYPIMSLPLA